MARRRFFVDLVRDGRAEITGKDAHHLARVLRVEPGQIYEITDSRHAWLAGVAAVGRNLVEFTVMEEIPSGPKLAPVTLFLSLIRFESFEWAVEKATELGVTRIVPVEAARSERGLFEAARKRAERWRRVAREASEQSRRLSTPEVSEPVRLAQAVTDSATHRIWLDEQPGASLLMRALTLSSSDAVALLVGPEGGWTQSERDLMNASLWTRVSLGPSILRTETAVCAAMAVLAQMHETIRMSAVK